MVTSIDAAAPESTSVTAPSTTALLNLAAYMYVAYDTPYSSTPLAKNIGFTPLMYNGAPVLLVDDPNGVYAEAFVSTGPGPKQVVVGYEGTKSFFQGNQFTVGQLIDDTQLWGGKFADSFDSSANFASQVVAIASGQGIAKGQVFVTGHSLGAADAEYAASADGLGGAAFAGPGINTAFTGSLPPSITDYVDAGDPVGNYAADGNNVLAPELVSNDIKHYGNLVVLPNLKGKLALIAASAIYAAGGPREKQAAFLGAIATNGKYHEVSNYAADLGVPLYVDDGSQGAASGFFGSLSSSGNVGVSDNTAPIIGGGSDDHLQGTAAADLMFGGRGNDYLRGGQGNDVLMGGAGRDTLVGGPGDDVLMGGSGKDRFLFSPSAGQDTISDFQVQGSAHDVVVLSGAKFTDLAGAIHHTTMSDGSATIHLDANNSVTLQDVTKAQLLSHPNDFRFT